MTKDQMNDVINICRKYRMGVLSLKQAQEDIKKLKMSTEDEKTALENL